MKHVFKETIENSSDFFKNVYNVCYVGYKLLLYVIHRNKLKSLTDHIVI